MRKFKHARTGRSVAVPEGTRMERLVEADKNWTEEKSPAAKAPAKKSASSKTEK